MYLCCVYVRPVVIYTYTYLCCVYVRPVVIYTYTLEQYKLMLMSNTYLSLNRLYI